MFCACAITLELNGYKYLQNASESISEHPFSGGGCPQTPLVGRAKARPLRQRQTLEFPPSQNSKSCMNPIGILQFSCVCVCACNALLCILCVCVCVCVCACNALLCMRELGHVQLPKIKKVSLLTNEIILVRVFLFVVL